MGLDITAYSKLRPVGKHQDHGWCENEDHITAFAYTSFPASFLGLPILSEGSGGMRGFFDGGCYEPTPDTVTYGFRAGSYSGYGLWRDDLRQQFNPRTAAEEPFFELIYFADNEGSIGPVAAFYLLDDFRVHEGMYVPPEWSTMRKYQDWMRACELASDSGLIQFH